MLNDFAKACHEASRTWWHHPKSGLRLNRNKGELMMLVVSEVAEAMEGERKNLMDDHLPHRPMAEVEIADALIRCFDYAGAYGCDINVRMPDYSGLTLNDFAKRAAQLAHVPENKGEALLCICRSAVAVRLADDPDEEAEFVRGVVFWLLAYAGKHGYDVHGAVVEKMAYNAQRADHKPEARLAAGGKQW